MTGRFSFVGQAMAGVYGVSVSSAEPTRFDFPADSHRAGILSQPSFLTANASDHDDRRRVFRGLVIRKRLLCTDLPAPPPGAITTPVEDRVADARCASCHNLMDPIGVAFDGFDAIGRSVGTTQATGTIHGGGPLTGDFVGNEALGEMLAGSSIVQGCYLQQWLRFALGRDIHLPDVVALESLHDTFQVELDIEGLLVGMVQSELLTTRYSPHDACEGAAL